MYKRAPPILVAIPNQQKGGGIISSEYGRLQCALYSYVSKSNYKVCLSQVWDFYLTHESLVL